MTLGWGCRSSVKAWGGPAAAWKLLVEIREAAENHMGGRCAELVAAPDGGLYGGWQHARRACSAGRRALQWLGLAFVVPIKQRSHVVILYKTTAPRKSTRVVRAFCNGRPRAEVSIGVFEDGAIFLAVRGMGRSS
jgi:hypothetical protein